MKIVDHTAKTPEENVALDEVLLAKAEEGALGETLRLWSSPEYFVVLGRACKADEDCFMERCRRDGIKVLRRVSGGGTVLQGPGCLNYSLVLAYESASDYRDIRKSYRNILGKIADALNARECRVTFFPLSDLALNKKKVSGNAQARKRRYFLHHGTFLFDFDLEKIPLYLKNPKAEPQYRKARIHEEFVTNISLEEDDLKKLVLGVFPAKEKRLNLSKKETRELESLAGQKYKSDEWNLAF